MNILMKSKSYSFGAAYTGLSVMRMYDNDFDSGNYNVILGSSGDFDEQTGVKAFCSADGCGRRLIYQADGGGYLCPSCNSYYPPESFGAGGSSVDFEDNNSNNNNHAGSNYNSLAPLSEVNARKREMLLDHVQREPRSIMSLPDPESMDDTDRRSLMTPDEQRYEDLGWHNYREVEISGNSPNVIDTQKENERIRLQKERERVRKYYGLMSRTRGKGGLL